MSRRLSVLRRRRCRKKVSDAVRTIIPHLLSEHSARAGPSPAPALRTPAPPRPPEARPRRQCPRSRADARHDDATKGRRSPVQRGHQVPDGRRAGEGHGVHSAVERSSGRAQPGPAERPLDRSGPPPPRPRRSEDPRPARRVRPRRGGAARGRRGPRAPSARRAGPRRRTDRARTPGAGPALPGPPPCRGRWRTPGRRRTRRGRTAGPSTAPTAFALVNTSHWYSARRPRAASSAPRSGSDSMATAGTSTGIAPSAASRPQRPAACERGRVTMTLTPSSGPSPGHYASLATSAEAPIASTSRASLRPTSSGSLARPSSVVR